MKIDEIVALKEKEAGRGSEEADKLNLALQSVQKRILFCEYHYLEVLAFSDNTSLFRDRFSEAEHDGILISTIYEANIYAFIQNLHALIDSLPYALNLFCTVCSKVEHQGIGWSKKFTQKYADFPFYDEFMDICRSETFSKLKSMNNRVKHKHLIRIRNKVDKLLFDDFTYFHDGGSKEVKQEDVMSFMNDCHDLLLPQYIAFWDNLTIYKRDFLKYPSTSSFGDEFE